MAPAFSNVRAGERFSVEMELEANQAEQVQAFLDFDPAILRVVDSDGNPTNQIVPGDAFGNVTVNGADNATGRVALVAAGGPVSGRTLVATVHFRAITTTVASALTWSLAAPRTTDVLADGASVLGNVQRGVVRAASGAFLAGGAFMQSPPPPPSTAWSVPLLLTLGRAGERGPDYLFGTQSDQLGAFTMPGVAASGRYNIRLAGLHTLRNLLPATLTAGANTARMGTLLEGDALDDNRVDGHDVSLVAAAFGKAQGQPGFNPRADFDENDTINQADLGLLAANLGRRGDVYAGAQAASSATQDWAEELETLSLSASPAAGAVALTLAPTNTVAAVGKIVLLEVIAEAGTQRVDTGELHIDYDPTRLQLVTAAGVPALQIEAGGRLPVVLLNAVDAARGRADYVATVTGDTVVSGRFTLAGLRFKVLQPGQTTVRFSFSPWRPTDLIYQGASMLGSVRASQIRAAAQRPVYLPLIVK